MNKCDFQTNALTTQYRMHPDICKLPNEIFYRGALRNSTHVRVRRNVVLDQIRDVLEQSFLSPSTNSVQGRGREDDRGFDRDRDRDRGRDMGRSDPHSRGGFSSAGAITDGNNGNNNNNNNNNNGNNNNNNGNKRRKPSLPGWLSSPFVFVDAPAGTTPGSREIGGTEECPSFGNEQEAILIAKICVYLKKVCKIRIKEQVNIITFYNAQVKEIKQRLQWEGMSYQEGTGPKVSTVDSYQGSEADIIILSFVRSNKKLGTGFVKDMQVRL